MAKKNHTLVNGMSPVTTESGGTVVTSPNVCLTPAPSGQVPVPYPSIAKSEDLANGSKSVTLNGAAVCLSSSRLSRSTGDEAGTGGGVASGTRGGPAWPVSYSFDVKIEGKPVVRNLDLFLSKWPCTGATMPRVTPSTFTCRTRERSRVNWEPLRRN